jgi:hypothetical protein
MAPSCSAAVLEPWFGKIETRPLTPAPGQDGSPPGKFLTRLVSLSQPMVKLPRAEAQGLPFGA